MHHSLTTLRAASTLLDSILAGQQLLVLSQIAIPNTVKVRQASCAPTFSDVNLAVHIVRMLAFVLCIQALSIAPWTIAGMR